VGQDTAAALKQVETARAALESDLSTLLDRLPPAARLAQGAAAGGGGLLALGVAGKVLSKQAEKRRYVRQVEREATIQARAIAAAFAHAHIPSVPTAAISLPTPPPVPVVERAAAALEVAADADDDDGGHTLLLLLVSLVAAVVAYVVQQRSSNDDDLWIAPADDA
jgi:hypothetical protein